jgi:hypothetical protein
MPVIQPRVLFPHKFRDSVFVPRAHKKDEYERTEEHKEREGQRRKGLMNITLGIYGGHPLLPASRPIPAQRTKHVHVFYPMHSARGSDRTLFLVNQLASFS